MSNVGFFKGSWCWFTIIMLVAFLIMAEIRAKKWEEVANKWKDSALKTMIVANEWRAIAEECSSKKSK
jgi:hypothetical protein